MIESLLRSGSCGRPASVCPGIEAQTVEVRVKPQSVDNGDVLEMIGQSRPPIKAAALAGVSLTAAALAGGSL